MPAMSAKRLSSFFGKPYEPNGTAKGKDAPAAGSAPPTPSATQKTQTAQKTPLSVSALLMRVKDALATLPAQLAVVGEISNLKRHSSGHMYFRLKDANSAIDAVMFRQDNMYLKFTPADGMEVVAEGRVDVYEVRGQLQMYVERMTPKGAGALELAFRQLCEKLKAEGLFDPAHRKPIPRFPRAIGIVTSPTGAAVRDIARTLRRRWPAARVYLAPALVQGEGAAQSVAEAVRLLDANAAKYEIDTIIVARGGGSLEDLWAFNEEIVARAIYAARTPIISGVGHEVDVTIADMVADMRAATPTAAAELAVPATDEIAAHISHLAGRLARNVSGKITTARAELNAVCRSSVFRDPTARIRTQMQRLDELSHKLRAGLHEMLSAARKHLEPLANRLALLHPVRLNEKARAVLAEMRHKLNWGFGGLIKRQTEKLADITGRLTAAHPRHRLLLARQQVAAIERQLEAMSHKNVLKRGFSVTRIAGGAILRSVQQVQAGMTVETELADGKFTSEAAGGKPAAKKQINNGNKEHDAPLFD